MNLMRGILSCQGGGGPSLDEGVREGLAIEVDTSLPAERVVRVLEQVVACLGRPRAIRLDNGPEWIADPVYDLV